MKRPRLITRRRAKWVGLIASVILLVVAVASKWVAVGCIWNSRTIQRTVYVDDGLLCCEIRNDGGKYRSSSRSGWLLLESGTGYDNLSYGLWFYYHPAQSFLIPDSSGPITVTWIGLPLWLPWLLIAAPTAWLWRTDRRAKPWQCPKCRYDLRGLDAGVCPECGTPITDAPK